MDYRAATSRASWMARKATSQLTLARGHDGSPRRTIVMFQS